MQCPYCKNTKSTVVDTYRLTVEIVRIRRCDLCKNYWETIERVERKVSPEEKAKERIQMNIFEVTTTSPQTPLQSGEGQKARGDNDEED